MDDNLARLCTRMNREGVEQLRMLFPVATTLSLLIVAWPALLKLIRWINEDPEKRDIRLLWAGLWSGGAGFMLVALFSLWHVGRRFFQ